jgi:flagella basal body P-ring formation protein FlgA
MPRAATFLVLIFAAGLARAAAADGDASITAAIEAAVRARMGSSAAVTVIGVTGVRVEEGPGVLTAVPVPTARLGTPIRFLLERAHAGASRRAGEATATVRVVAEVVRSVAAFPRGHRFAAGDLISEEIELTSRSLRELPTVEDIVGARATRDIAVRVVIAHTDFVGDPLVRSGDEVTALLRIGEIELTNSLIAAQNGAKGQIIRVVHPETRRAVRARVTGRAEVEVVHVR